jgi:hypothetical protein
MVGPFSFKRICNFSALHIRSFSARPLQEEMLFRTQESPGSRLMWIYARGSQAVSGGFSLALFVPWTHKVQVFSLWAMLGGKDEKSLVMNFKIN